MKKVLTLFLVAFVVSFFAARAMADSVILSPMALPSACITTTTGAMKVCITSKATTIAMSTTVTPLIGATTKITPNNTTAVQRLRSL